MKIAILAGPHVPIPPQKYGGIEQVIYYLIKGLKEAGHEPILLGPGDSEVDCRIIPTVPKAIFFPKYKKDLPAHYRQIKSINRNTARILRKLLPEIDIIHFHGLDHDRGFDMTKFANFPSVTTIHSKIGLSDIDYFNSRKDLFYVSISKNQQAVLPELNYANVVYNGEDPDQFPKVLEPEDYLCFLGRFDRDKNPHLAIQLALNLGMKIKLAGKRDFESEGYFEEEIEKYLDHPLVEYLGEIGFEDKVELISKAKCNLHPTNFREPFGLTVLEAAYCGTPTLAISRGSMPELIEPGRTGILVEDFEEGRHKIEECYAMDREYIASRARQLFNYKSMAEHYVETYEKVLADYATRPSQQNTIARKLINRVWEVISQHSYKDSVSR